MKKGQFCNMNTEIMNLDCLLIYTPKMDNFYNLYGDHIFGMYMPIGLLAIAEFLHRNGYKTRILHLGIEKIANPYFSLQKYLKTINVKIIGLSLHWHFQSYDAIQIVREIKLLKPDIFIVLGGFTASYFYEEIINNFDSVDAIIRGDGEIPLLQLMKEIFKEKRNFYTIPNLTWRNGNKIIINKMDYSTQSENLEDLNFTNLEVLNNYFLYIQYSRIPWFWIKGFKENFNLALSKLRIFPLLITMGCPVTCSFCGGSKFSQKIISGRTGIAIRSVDKVIESMVAVKKYGYDAILINYFPFNESRSYFTKWFDGVKSKNINIDCIVECWDLPPDWFIQLFKSTFLNSVESLIVISPDTGSERIRKLNKGFYFSNTQLYATLEYAESLKVSVELCFAIGTPFETLEDIKITNIFQDSLKKRFKDIKIRTAFIELDPACQMYIDPQQYGIIKTRDSFADYLKSHSDDKSNSFSSSYLGYFKKGCYSIRRAGKLNADYCKELQAIKCNNFCVLNSISLESKLDKIIPKNMLRLLSRLFCHLIGFYWRLNLHKNIPLKFKG